MKKFTLSKAFALFFALIVYTSIGWAQETVVYWDFSDEAKRDLVTNADPVDLSLYTADEGTGTINLVGPNFTGWVLGAVGPEGNTSAPNSNTWNEGADTKYWQITTSTTGFEELKLSSIQRGSATGPRDFKVQYSIDDGSTWTDVPGVVITVANDFVSGVLEEVLLPEETNDQTTLHLRWIMTSNISVRAGTGTHPEDDPVQAGGTNRIDGILLTGEEILEEPAEFETLFQFSNVDENLPDWFGSQLARGLATHGDNLYVANRNAPAGEQVQVHNRFTGAITGSLNTNGITGGTFPINDIETSEDGVVLVGNLTINEPAVFKIYLLDETADATPIIEFPLDGTSRLGDKFAVVGSFNDGSAVIYAADASTPRVYKWIMSPDPDKDGFSFGDPLTISTTAVGATNGSNASVAALPNGDFYITGGGINIYKLNADGSLIGMVPGGIVATGSSALKYLGTDGDDEILAVFLYGVGNEKVRMLRIPNGDPTAATIEFDTPTLGDVNSTGNGGVTFEPAADGNNADLYFLSATNGIAAYETQNFDLEFPVYLPPAEPVLARAQIIHNSADPAAAAVDVFVNGGLALENFAFRTATPFIDLPAEVELTIDIAPAGAGIGESVFTMQVTLVEDETYVIVANGLLDLDKDEISTDFTLFPYAPAREEATVATNTDVLVFHGSTDAPTVSVWTGGETPAELFVFSYGEFQPYLELPTADYILEIRTEDGETVVASYVAPLETLDLDGEALTVLASGFLGSDKNAEFGLFVALAAGGALVELPLYEEEEPLIGDSCDNPIIVDVVNAPLVDFEISSEPYPDLFANTWVTPNSSYLNGNNIVFQFTLENSSFVSGSIAGSWTGIFVVATCPDPDNPAEVLASGVGSTGGSFADVPLAAGDYFVVVGTWPAPQFTDMTINLSAVEVPADPALVVVPDTLDVGFAFAGVSTVSGSVFLSNEGGADVVIEESDITFTGAQADRFSFELADSELSFPLNIEFEEVVELIVTFDPDATGPAEAEMVIAWNSPDETDATVALFATGYEPFTAFFENFDDATPPDIPAPWTGILDVTGGSAFVDLRTIGNPYSPPHHVRLANGNNIVGDVMLVTPMVTDMESSWVRFFAKMAVAAQVENLAVGYMTDANDASTFVPLDTFAITGTYNQYVLSLAELAAEKDIVFPEYGFIAFRNNMEVTFRTFYLDDIAYEPQPDTPVFATNKDEVDFGDMVYLNQTVTQNLVISNVGTGTISINETDINITGADAASFDMVYDEEMEWPIELETGETFELTLSFTPDEVRVFNADLEIEDNIGDKAVNVIPLTGTGYDPTVTPPYFIDFIGDFPPLDWTRWSGELNDTTELSPVTAIWVHGKFGNQTELPENNAAKMNIWGGARNHWLITPPIDLGDGSADFMLNFDLALTGWNNPNPATMGPNQYFAVVISTDGETWVPANILQLWDGDDEISNTGQPVTLDLTEYSGSVQIGFYGESRPGGGDVDVHVTNVHVREIQFFDVTFNVEDSEGDPITDATVTLGDQTLTAAPYVFEDVLVGDYEYEVSRLGYLPVTGSVSVDDEDVVVNVVLMDAFTVDFTVTDGTEPIEGAMIEVFDTDEVEIASLLTNEDGQAGLIMSPGDYTYNVSAFMYLPVIGEAFSVTDQDLDITVTLSMPDPLELPFVEDFNDTIIPPLWMVIDQPNHTAPVSWKVIAALGTSTIDGTPFAIIDSDAAGSGAGTLNSMLYTPAIDASEIEGGLVLSFEQFYRHLGADAFARVEVYDGVEWITLANYTTTQGSWAEPVLAMFDITAYANDNLRVRFHYTDGGSWAWYWAIDNVSIVEMPLYTLALNVNPEGWGTVTGAGEYIEGAQVEVTATANMGYEFLNWTDEEGEVVSTEPDNIITMPDSDLTLTANFIVGVADPLTLNTLLDKIGDNLPPEISTGGNARSAALFQERYVVVTSHADEGTVWVWDMLNPHLDPYSLDKGEDVIVPLTFPVNYVRTTDNAIYVSNLSLNPSGEGWGQGIFKVYRWTSLEGTPEAVISFDVLPGRLGDAFSIIGDPEDDGHIIAHINTTNEFRVWNFENGVLQNEDNPDLITLNIDVPHINNHGIINPIEDEDDIFVLTSNNIGIKIVDLDGEILAGMDTDVIDQRTYDPNIFYFNGNRYLSYTINNEGNAEVGARHQIVDISLGETVVEAIEMINTSSALANRIVYDKVMGTGHPNLTGTNQIAFDEDGELMVLAHVVGTGFILETTGVLPATYALTLEANPEEGGTVEGDGDYYEGATVPVSAVAADGFEFVNWTHDGDVVSTEASFNFTMPGEATTLTANFEELVIEDVATLAELRTKPDDGTLYRYTGDAVIVAMDGFRNRKFLQDETAAILIDDQPGVITTEYDLYDVITNVVGQINIWNNMIRFQPAENTDPATENTPVDPTVFMLDEVTSDDQAKLIKFYNVTFTGIDDGQEFANGTNYTITDGDNEFVIRTDFWDVDYIGTEIPTEPVNITGVMIQFQETFQLVPRFAADFEEYVEPVGFNVTFNVDMTPAEDFDPDNDVVYITGSMFGWAAPGDQPENQTMTRVDESMIWTKTLVLEAGTYEYKYFINAGWSGEEWPGDPNRVVEVTEDMVVNNEWGDLVNVDDFDLTQINVFPNPARDNFNITAGSMIRSVVIADITGKVVYNDIINDTQTRILNAFETGIYIVRIYTDDGVFVRKLQIQK